MRTSTGLTSEEREALLNTLWHRSLVGVAILDAKGRFKHANPAFCDVVEYSEPELQLKTFHEITHPQDLMADVQMAEEVHESRRDHYVMKKRYITKTGRIVWVVLAVDPLLVEGEFHYFVSQISEVVAVETPANPPAKRKPILPFVKEYLAVGLAVLAAVAILIAEIIKRF